MIRASITLASLLVFTSCGMVSTPRCDSTTCVIGCCDSSGECQPTRQAACGVNGISCRACLVTETCTLGQCVPNGVATGGGAGSFDAGSDAGVDAGRPALVAIDFTVDDSANQVFKAGELDWKGSFVFDPSSRIITRNAAWKGPYPTLYDDGPWADGGHEPLTSYANDHRWGVTVFARVPDAGVDLFEYGVQDHTNLAWLWKGSNGTFVIAAGASASITAPGLTLLPFGSTDLKVVIDTNALLTTNGSWDTSKVEFKGSALGWTSVELADDGLKGDEVAGDKRFTFQLSRWVGPGTTAPHVGLAAHGDLSEFVVLFAGAQYTAPDTNCAAQGVTAASSIDGGFASLPIGHASNGNCLLTVP